MNARSYKTVFSKRLGTLVAVGEHASSQGKAKGAGQGVKPCFGVFDGFVGVLSLGFALVGAAWAGPVAVALPTALPTGGQVAQGVASISQAGANMSIVQGSAKAAINWNTFDIGTGAKVNIVQPGSSSVLLNRVTSTNPSQIFGQLSANGQVVLVNPNGIVFGQDGSVSASSFTASTLGISDADFLAGNNQYQRKGSTAAVVNQGTISTTGGYVALLGASVSNEGRIQTQGGTAYLGAAETIKIPVSGSGRIKLELSPSSINSAVSNAKSGTIVTEGGQVYMQAAALNNAVASIIQSGGIDTTGAQGGAVHLLTDGGEIKVDGSITANSTGKDEQGQQRKGADIVIGRDEETGALARATDVSGAKLESNNGFVETSGEWLKADAVRVKAGEWLLDPTNITIAASGASGTAYASTYTAGADSVILASDINTSLNAGTSVTIATSATGASAGNIAVNESIAKTAGAAATLTLKAHGDITLAANKTITSTSGNLTVTLNSDFGGNGSGAIAMASGSGITSNGGNVTLGGGSGGAGAGSAYGSASNLFGISLIGASINSGAGNVTLTGTSYTAGNSIWGVNLDSGATITTTSGNVNITATGQTSGQYGYGMMIQGTNTKISTGSGNITVNATSSANASSDALGIKITAAGAFTTSNGNIAITGTSLGATGNYNQGIGWGGSGSVVAGSTGSVSLTGTGNGNGTSSAGVSGARVTTTGASVSITGTSSGSAMYDIQLGGADAISTSGGNIAFTANSYGGGGTETINAGTGVVTIQNRTAGTLINVGGADVLTGSPLTLGVSNAELNRITAATTKVGSTTAGNLTVSAPITSVAATGNLYLQTNGTATVNASSALASGAGLYIQTTGGNITNNSAISGTNITLDNTNGTINTSTGAVTAGAGTAGSAVGISIGADATATGNLNLYGVSTSGKGIEFASGKSISGGTIQATGKTTNGAYGVLFNGSNTVTTTGSSGDSSIKGMTTAGGTNALLAWGSLNLTAATGTTLTLWGDGASTGDRAARFDGGGSTTGAVTLKGTSNNAAALMLINGAFTANANSALTMSGVTSGSGQSGVYFVNGGGVSLNNGATLNITGQNTNASGAGTGVAIAGAGVAKAAGATSAGAVSITGSTSSSSGSTGVSAASGVTTDGNITIQGTVASSSNTGVNIGGAITSAGTATTISISSNYSVSNAGSISISGATGTGGNINLSSTNAGISGAGTIGSTTNKNGSVTFTQGGNSTYDGAINANNFTKAGIGVLTLDSWAYTTPVLTNISNSYSVNGGTLNVSTGSSYNTLNPTYVYINNGTTFGGVTGNATWNGTSFIFDANGGGTIAWSGNPIMNTGTAPLTFKTQGGATNNITGWFNMNVGSGLTFDIAPASTLTNPGVLLSGGNGFSNTGSTVVTKTGSGLLRVTNLFSAPTLNINAGTWEFGDGTSATGSTSLAAGVSTMNIAIASGATLSYNTPSAQIMDSATTSFTGAGSILKKGAGTVQWNTSAGTFALSAGALIDVQAGTFIGGSNSNEIWTNNKSSLNVASGATFDGREANVIVDALTGSGALKTGWNSTGGSITLGVNGTSAGSSNNATGTSYNASGTASFSGVISTSVGSSSGSIAKSGAGIQILTGVNTYTGATTVSGGTLQLGNNGTTGSVGTGDVTLGTAGTLTFNRSDNFTFSNKILGQSSGNGAVIKNNSNILTLSGANTYGTTQINSGVLYTSGNASAFGTGLVTVASGAQAYILDTTVANDFNIAGGGTTFGGTNLGAIRLQQNAATSTGVSGKITLNGAATIGAQLYSSGNPISGGVFTLGAIDGTGPLTYQSIFNPQTFSVSGAGSYSGNTTAQGNSTLKFTGAGTPGASTGGINLASVNDILEFAGNSLIVGNQITGAGKIVQSGGNTTTLTGANTYTGTTTVSGGTLQIGNGGGTGALGTGGAVTLSNNANLSFVRSTATTIANSISGTGNVSASITGASSTLTVSSPVNLTSGTVNLAADSDLSVTAAIATTNATNSAVLLNAGKSTAAGTSTGGNLVISGSGAVTVGSGGRAALMTGSVAGSTGLTALVGSGTGNFRYNSDETNTNYTTALGAGLYGIYREAPALTATLNSVTKTYDGLAYSGGNGIGTLSGYVNGDTAAQLGSITYGGAAQTAKNYGTYALTGTAASGVGYAVTLTAGTLTVNKANLTLSGTRVYDAGTTYAGNYLTATGVNGETFALTGSGDASNLSSKNVQTNQLLSSLTGLSLGTSSNGGLSSNYNALSVTGSSVSVTQKAASYTATATRVTYNGNLQNQTASTQSGFINGDALTFTGEASGTHANTYASNLQVSGADANNYNVTVTNANLVIDKANLALSGTRVYDQGTTFAGTYLTATGVHSESFTVTGAGSNTNLSSKNVQTAQALNSVTGLSLGVSNGSNAAVSSDYNGLSTAGSSVSVTAKSATVDATPTTLTYNGLTQTQQAATSSGFIAGDAITITGLASGKNFGTYSSTLSVSGADAGNYTVTRNDANLQITKATLTATGNSSSVTYNGASQSVSGYAITGLVGSDTVSDLTNNIVASGATGTNAGNYTNTVTAGLQTNYTVSTVNGTLTIAKAPLTATGKSSSVTYNGYNQTVAADFDVTGLQGNDTKASLSSISAVGFTAKNAGDYVNVVNAGTETNYTVTPVNGSLHIGKAGLIATGNSANVTYNGATQTVTGFSVSGLLGSDLVGGLTTISASGASGQNVGGYTNTVTAGTEANYTVSTVNGSLQIGKANLTLSGSKVYNASTNYAGSALTATGVAGETFAVTGSGDVSNLASKDVQTNQLLASVTGLNLGASSNGGLAGNYNALTTTASSVSVTPAAASVTGTLTNVTYNGATQTQSAPTSSGFYGGDAITVAGWASGKNAGTYTSNLSVSGADAGNYTVTYTNRDLVIDRAPLTVTATQVTKTYDGGLGAAGAGTVGVLAGAAAGDLVSSVGAQAFLDKNAGTGKTVRASGVTIRDANNADMTGNYSISYVDNTTSVINKAPLTVTANSDARFVTQNDASLFNGVSYSGLVGGETSAVLGGTLGITRTNAVNDVGANTYPGVLVPSGLTSSNYDISFSNGNYQIVPANQLLIKTTNQSVVYGTAPTFSTTAQYLLDDGHNPSQLVTLSRTGTANNYTFSDGAGGSVTTVLKPYTGTAVTSTSGSTNTVVGTYDVKDANPTVVGGNFVGAPVFIGTLTVDTKAVTPSVSGVSKVYDGTTSMNNVVVGMSGKVTGDSLSIGGAGAITQKNVGTGLGYTISNIALSGGDAANYHLSGGATSFSGTDGAITAAPLVLTTSNVSKTYDRTTTATGTAVATQGTQLFGSDTLAGGTFSFTNANAGLGNKVVTVGGVAVNDGNGGANYSVSYVNNTTSTINPKLLGATYVAASKTYNGNATASVTGASDDIIGADAVNFSNTSATFDTKNVGAGKTVTITGIAISGADAGNYSLQSTTVTTTADITAKALTASFSGTSKVYDGGVSASVTGSSVDKVTGDALTFASTSATYDTKNVGANKPITVSGITLGGADAGNYALQNTGATATGAITRKDVTLTSITAANKTYDGTAVATVTGGAVTTGISGEALNLTGTGAFSDKNANTGKTVTVSDVSSLTKVNGTGDWGNYNLVTTGAMSTTANIAQAALTVTATAVSKTYDATLGAGGSGVVGALAGAGDVVNSVGSQAFLDKNAGTGKTVRASGVTLKDASNADMTGNYLITYVDNAGGVINRAPLEVTTPNVTKSYDGTVSASSTAVLKTGTIYAGDSLSGGTFAFTDKNQGVGNKTVTVAGVTVGDGVNTGNYDVTYITNTTSTINKAALTVTASAVTKTYDGSLLATGTGTVGVLAGAGAGEVVGSAGSQTFLDANAGPGKTVRASGVTLKDSGNADVTGNYVISYVDNTSSTINKASLTAALQGNVQKQYDSTTAASGLSNANFAIGGWVTVGGATQGATVSQTAATYASPNVSSNGGTGLVTAALQASNFVANPGTELNNYTLPTSASGNVGRITAAPLELSTSNVTKTYDGTVSAAGTAVVKSGTLFSVDSLSGGTFAFADKNAGTNKTVTVSGVTVGNGTSTSNYAVTYADNTTSTIHKADVTVTATAVTKTYDGTLLAAGTGTVGALAGAGAGETVNSAGIQAFLDANAGTGKTVRASGVSLKDSGNADVSSNYNIFYVDNTSSTINKAALTANILGPISKQYDGTTAATGLTNANFSVTGWANVGEGVTVNLTTATYASPNVSANAGTGSVSTALQASHFAAVGSTNLSNYTLPTTASGNVGTITPAPLTVKVNNTAMFVTQDPNSAFDQGFTYTGLKNGESGLTALGPLIRTFTGAVNPAAGSYSAVYDLTTVPTAANYTVTVQKGDLTVARADQLLLNVGSTSATYGALTASNAGASATSVTAQYCLVSTNCNGANIANLTMNSQGAGRWTATDVANSTISFDTVVDTTGRISGAGFVNAGNYTFTANNLSTTGTVNYSMVVSGGVLTVDPKALTLNASNVTKVYDGTTALAGMPLGLTGSLTGDQVSVTSSGGTFGGKNVGNQSFSLTGLQLQGTDRDNYTFTANSVTGTGTITPKTLTLSASASDKAYDGTTSASVGALSVSGAIAGDTVSATGGTASFADKNVARDASGRVVAKPVTISGVTLTGADAGNYQADTGASVTATITPLTVNASVTAQNKVYDGTTQAQVSGTVAGTLGSDAVSVTSSSSTFASKNVVRDAAGRPSSQSVNVAGLSLTGADAVNYNLASTTATSTATITPKVLNASGAVADKVYDGSAQASLTGLNGSGIVAGDAVSVQASSAAFSDKNVARDASGQVIAKTVTVTGLSIGGADANNYELMGSSFTAQASILPRSLNVVATAQDKVYDGSTAATGSVSANNIVAGDALQLSWGAGSFASKDVSRNAQGQVQSQGVSFGNLQITGADVGNYSLTSNTASTTATISPKVLQASGTVVADKPEDGNTTAKVTVGTLVGLVGSEQLVATAAGSFNSATAGSDKPVQVSYSLKDGAQGGLAGNYEAAAQVLKGNIMATNRSNPVQPIVVPSKPAGGGSKVVVANAQPALNPTTPQTSQSEAREECSILSPEKCECRDAAAAGVEICVVPRDQLTQASSPRMSLLRRSEVP